MLRLDDFYKDGDDPTLPRITEGANAGIVDWDDPRRGCSTTRWPRSSELCRDGRADVPVYDIAHDGRTGSRRLDARRARRRSSPRASSPQEIVAACREAGLLAAAFCVRQHPMVTFWRRLTRDLREHRKPPLVLVRRGLALMRDQPRVVAHAVALGCDAGDRRRGVRQDQRVTDLADHSRTHRTCGPSVLVVAENLPGPWPDFEEQVFAMHRRVNRWWPRALGTTPWAVARELGGRRVRRFRQDEVLAALPTPVPVYLGSRWLPRHVVLVLERRTTASASMTQPAGPSYR